MPAWIRKAKTNPEPIGGVYPAHGVGPTWVTLLMSFSLEQAEDAEEFRLSYGQFVTLWNNWAARCFLGVSWICYNLFTKGPLNMHLSVCAPHAEFWVLQLLSPGQHSLNLQRP